MWSGYPDIAEELRYIEAHIKKNTGSRNKLLAEITADLLNAGGKRIRPALLVVSAGFGDYDRNKVAAAAGALEILHTATLVHDDLIDRSKLRRGKVTVSEKYGVDMAVYTGDFLFAKAVLMLSQDLQAEKVDFIAKAIKTICEGEVDQFEDRFHVDVTIFSYLKRIRRKTAILFGAACALGAYICSCSEDVVRNLAKFGLSYGMAFQIKDDLNDFLSSASTSGKPVGSDVARGIVTLPLIYAFSANKEMKQCVHRLFKDKKMLTDIQVEAISDMLCRSGGIAEAEKMLARFVDRGLKMLQPLPDNRGKQVLADMIIRLC